MSTIATILGGMGTMGLNAFLGDFIHDWVERVRGKSDPTPTAGNTNTDPKVDKVKPFLNLAILTKEDAYKFSRLMQKLNDNDKAHLSEFLLEYYLRPAEHGGLVTKLASAWLYDNFMLQSVNRDSPSRQVGTAKSTTTEVKDSARTDRTANKAAWSVKQKVANFDRTSTTGGIKTTTVTERNEDCYTAGGAESLAFLKELASIYEAGGVRTAEDFLRINQMPLMNAAWLAKADAFVGNHFESAQLKQTILARDTAIQNENKARGGIIGFLMRQC